MVFLPDGEACETQGELRAALGPLIYLDSAPAGAINSDDECLCWVDVAAMARERGYAATYCGDWTLTTIASR